MDLRPGWHLRITCPVMAARGGTPHANCCTCGATADEFPGLIEQPEHMFRSWIQFLY